jgi:error-prone DNA polymerase
MESMRALFVAGAIATHGVTPELANSIFDKLAGFADYGFPKSHAAAFGLLAYQSCWLRHYYPAEFLCALLNNQPMGFYAPHVLINDAKRHGLRVHRPDINLSEAACTVEGDRTVRIGLSFVKGLSDDVARAIVQERRVRGPFRSLADTVRRVSMPSGAAQNLISAGAFDGFGMRRRELLWQLGLFIPARGFGQSRRKRTELGKQIPLALPTSQDHVELPRTSSWEQMADEYRVLGLSPRFHPLGLMRPRLPKTLISSRDLENLPHGRLIRIPGLIVCRQRPATAKGITFLLLEDEFGLANIIVYPSLYEEQRMHVRSTPLLIVEGRLQKLNNNINILASRLYPLEDASFSYPHGNHDQKADPVSEEVDPRTIQLVHLDRSTPGPARREDIRALQPTAHNYR